MGNRLLIILPIAYVFYAMLTLDTAATDGDAAAATELAALVDTVQAALDAEPDAETISVAAPRSQWEAMFSYPQYLLYSLQSARISRNFQFWGGIFFAAIVFAIGISKRGWKARAAPRH